MRHQLPKGMIQHAHSRTSVTWVGLSVFALLLFVLFAGLQVGSFVAQHHDRVLPNVTLNGQNLAGMTRSELNTVLSQRVAQQVTFTVGSQSKTVALNETGLRVDVTGTVDDLLAYSSSPVRALRTVISPQDIPLRISYEPVAFHSFARSLSEMSGNAPQDASLILNEAGDGFVVRPAQAGVGVDSEHLRASLEAALARGNVTNVQLTMRQMEAEISTEEAEQAQSEAQALVSTEYAVVAPREKMVASGAEKASWVTFEPRATGQGEDTLVVRFDTEKASKWMDTVVEAANRAPINAIHHVDAAGNMLEVGRPAKTGVQIINADAATEQLMDAVENGVEAEVSLKHVEVPAGVENRVKPAGPERFAYQPRGNEKWVDVNLTYSTLTAYEGLTPVYGPILINHGGVGHETVTGTYRVYLKYDKQDMGCTPDWPYCEKDVPSVAYWYKDYALHGAPWVKEFGIGTDESSHGCINIPVPDAEWLHRFTEIGTTVVTHYEAQG